jgi:hypothetical protein
MEGCSWFDRSDSFARRLAMATTLFKKVDYTLSKLIEDIRMGEIGLPDIQRPFVWPNIKVRNLFDSMYRGYPVGYLLFWATFVPDGHRQVGGDQKQKVPNLLIVDGQQRLTSLYAVLTATPVLRENFKHEKIRIAFSPVSEQFEVADAAIDRDAEFIPDISDLWAGDIPRARFVRRFIERLQARREVLDKEEDHLSEVIDKVFDLQNYPFTALELSSQVNAEQVAEVFVRINSEGTLLSQADFILTLMSVFWDKGRKGMEDFCRDARKPSASGPSAYNHFFQPDPDHMLRASVGLAFRRARLQHVYSVLRGKDLKTGEFSAERREEQFRHLEEAQEYVLDLQNWHDFFKALIRAGYRRGDTISSKMGLVYSYLMFLVGKRDYGVDPYRLRNVIARWFFMTALTGRYTGSPETVMEKDLARLGDVNDADGFVALLDRIIDETLTTDYWSIGLPNALETQAARSPSLFAYYAALIILDARVLFSKLKVAELMDPVEKAKKKAVERHHLFPKAYLASIEISSRRLVNQIANMAVVEWPDNTKISKSPPSEYWPEFSARLSTDELADMRYWHGLFDGWETTPYDEFLVERRKRLAAVIKDAFETLREAGHADRDEEERREEAAAQTSRRTDSLALIEQGESAFVEFKESARWSHIHGEKEKTSEHEVVRTVAGFLNGRGGTLFIGVSNDGEVIGLRKDFKSIQGRPDKDGWENWLTGVLRENLGPAALVHLTTTFEDIDGRTICRIDAGRASDRVLVNERRFFLRLGNTTQELNMKEAQDYIRTRWPRR